MTVVSPGGSVTYRMISYIGWHVGEVFVDGVSVGPVSTYRFNNVSANHTIHVTYETDQAAPISDMSMEDVLILIDHLVNGTPLTGDYDFNADGVVNGKDLILLEQSVSAS